MPMTNTRLAGLLSGVSILTIFGVFWAVVAALNMPAPWNIGLSAASVVAAVAIGFATGRLSRAGRSLSATVDPAEAAYWRGTGWKFGLVFGTEIVLIAAASTILGIRNQNALIAPATALIVGVHFLPLAGLFRVRAYFVTGGLLSVGALAAGALVLAGVVPSNFTPYLWSVAVGWWSALVLWTTALNNLHLGNEAVAIARAGVTSRIHA